MRTLEECGRGRSFTHAPGDTTALATVLATIAPGHAKASKTTKLLTIQKATEAMQKAKSVSYQPPS